MIKILVLKGLHFNSLRHMPYLMGTKILCLMLSPLKTLISPIYPMLI